ncbi:MAG: homoserine dehydrogenase [Chloroflexota bacterium]
MAKQLRLALIGFGTVGQGLAEILQSSADLLAAQQDIHAEIVAVSDLLKGSVYCPSGLTIDALLAAGRSGNLASYPDQPGLVRGLDALATIAQSNADVIIEVSYTDLKTGEPALSHVRAAFEAGKHAIITNKGPVALAYRKLADLAKRQGVFFGYEGTVMSGTPALRMAQTDLAGCTIHEVRGILNGTTNYILTQMENGAPYSAALAEAQHLGYAEAEPSGDVEGFDAAGKLVILANTVLGAALGMNDVDRTGITGLTPADIETARANGQRWKLIARAVRTDTGIAASVRPERLPLADPLASVGGVSNAITYDTDMLGAVTLIGPGAGRKETGFAILSDLVALARTL